MTTRSCPHCNAPLEDSDEEPRVVRIMGRECGWRYTQMDVDDAEALGYTDVEARFIAAGMVRFPPTS